MTPLYFCSSNLVYFRQKEPIDQSAGFQPFDYSREISLNLYFDRLFLLGIYKISAKKIKDLCFMTLKSNAKFKEKLICCFKNDKILVNIGPSA